MERDDWALDGLTNREKAGEIRRIFEEEKDLLRAVIRLGRPLEIRAELQERTVNLRKHLIKLMPLKGKTLVFSHGLILRELLSVKNSKIQSIHLQNGQMVPLYIEKGTFFSAHSYQGAKL